MLNFALYQTDETLSINRGYIRLSFLFFRNPRRKRRQIKTAFVVKNAFFEGQMKGSGRSELVEAIGALDLGVMAVVVDAERQRSLF